MIPVLYINEWHDVVPLLRPEILFDPQKAYSLVYEQLIDKMPGRRDRVF